MADNSVDSPVTPEITDSSVVELRRHSTGKASSGNSEGKVLPRYLRASTGSCHDFCKYGGKHAFEANEKLSIMKRVARKPVHQRSDELRASTSSKSTKKISSVKLTASVGSALQICETLGNHEHNHEMLTKSIDNSKQVEKEVSGNKKIALVKAQPLNHLKSHTYDLSKSRRQEISSASKKVEASSKSTAAFKCKEMKLSSKPKSVTEKTMFCKNPAEGFSGQRNSELGMEKRVDTSKVAARKLNAPSRASLSLKPSFHRVGSTNAWKNKSLKIVPHLKNHSETGKNKPKKHSDAEVEQKTRENNPKQHSDVEAEEKTRKDGPEKHSDVEVEAKSRKDEPEQHSDVEVEAKTRKDRPEQHSDGEVEAKTRKDGPAQHSDVEVEAKTRKDGPEQHSDVEVEAKTSKDRPELHSDVVVEEKTRKDRPELHSDIEVEEKTLHVIEIVGENKILQSDQNASHDAELSLPQLLSSPKFSCSSSSQSSSQDDQEESEYTTSEDEQDSISVKDEDEHIENGDDSEEVDQKGNPKNDGVVVDLEYQDRSQITKLKFRKGKWVEIKSEKSSPRMLKFRRGRILGETESGKGEAQRKSYKRRDGDVGESNDATTGAAEKVVLRHQDVQGKKDEQGLFNNVIEETATKLAETRKSKVKALVGAFETVISLQEKKLYASTGI